MTWYSINGGRMKQERLMREDYIDDMMGIKILHT